MGKYARPGSDGWTYKDQRAMEKWLSDNPITNAIFGLVGGIILLPFAILIGIVLIPVLLMLLIFLSPIWIPLAFIKGIFNRK